MSRAISIDAIKAGLGDRIDELMRQLYPNAKRDGDEWCLGNIFGAPSRHPGGLGSLRIRRTRGGKIAIGAWKDFGSGESGDILDLVAAGACDGDVKAAILWSRRFLGMEAMDPAEARRIEERAARQRRQAELDATAEKERRRRAGHALWLGASELPGTASERYLAGRALWLDELARLHPERRPPGALRHRDITSPDGLTRPALIATLVSPEGKALGCHRHFLAVQADGRVTKASEDPRAPMPEAKMALGSYAGGFIPVWRGDGKSRFADAGDLDGVVLTEGLEDALSAALETPELRVIAGVSLTNCKRLGGALSRFGRVYWHRHRDTTQGALDAGEAVTEALRRAGCIVAEVWAPAPFKDFNDARRAAHGLLPPHLARAYGLTPATPLQA